MGRASALLDRRRAAALAALFAALVAYYVLSDAAPDLPSGWDAAFVALVLMPAVFALVYLVLPLQRARGVFAVGLAFALLAVVCERADLVIAANFSKLAAATFVAFWFLGYFETVLWVALVAAIIPVVDSYSVFFGPTKHIVEERPDVFTLLSFAFPLPGERAVIVEWEPPAKGQPLGYNLLRVGAPRPINGDELVAAHADDLSDVDGGQDARTDYAYRVEAVYGDGRRVRSPVVESRWREEGVTRQRERSPPGAPREVRTKSEPVGANLGIPDLLFFGLFLGAAARFGLRVPWTWAAMVASFAGSLLLTVIFDVPGVPALPLLSLAFLAVNADLVWRALRERRWGELE